MHMKLMGLFIHGLYNLFNIAMNIRIKPMVHPHREYRTPVKEYVLTRKGTENINKGIRDMGWLLYKTRMKGLCLFSLKWPR